MKPVLTSKNKNFTFQRTVAILGIVLFLAKLLAWRLTSSDAVFSDALESIVNIIAAFMGLYSLYLAAKPVDHDHPYGHGKVEFVTSGIEGALIIFAGIMIIIQAADSVLHGNTLQKLDAGIYIIAATALVNYLIGYYSIQRGKKENSLVLQSSGKHLQSDTFTTLGVVLSLILVYLTGINWIDSVVALLFGAYIMFVGYKIIRKSLSGIMDEADLKMISSLANYLQSVREKQWVDLHNVRIQQHGSKLHIDAHLTLPYYLSLREAHTEMENVIKSIAKNTDRQIEFNFHMDDCKPFSCKICNLDTCPVREFAFEKQIVWTSKTITQPDKHTVHSEE
ncbi:cation diffusion facilitator family transporter [Chryseobacterium sp. A301]